MRSVFLQILLANLTGQDIYRSGVIRFLDAMLATTKKTPQGMLWIRAHGPNRYAGDYNLLCSFCAIFRSRHAISLTVHCGSCIDVFFSSVLTR